MQPPQSDTSVSRRRLLRRASIAAASAAAAGVYARLWQPNHIVVTELTVPVSGWEPAQSGFRIGHLSDLHCTDPAAIERTRRAVDMVMSRDPHAVFITGDYVTSHGEWHSQACAEALAPVTGSPGGAYAVLGNHDYLNGAHAVVERERVRVGIAVLRNNAIRMASQSRVWVAGTESMATCRHDAGAALADAPAGALVLLLAHEPDVAVDAPPGFAMQFSGHLHGGQIRLPGLPPLIRPPGAQAYGLGLEQAPYHPVFTSRGIGMIRPQFRAFCPPEVAVVSLVPA